jgi:hypothetical protein
MQKIISTYGKWLIILALLLTGVLASRTLFKHNFYFNMHDDLQMMRQLQLEKCFKDGQIPCRWVPDMGYGYGFPLFNYYPQLPYLFGGIFRLVNIPFNDVAKLTFALGIIASGFSMYLLAKEFFGKAGGLLSSVFYVWAPYHSVDVYVRGAMNESWAFIWFPLILWGIYKLIKKREKKYLITLSLSLAALLLTHNIMVMIFAPVALVWALGWFIESKSWKKVKVLGISGLMALGLSAFFTLPAIFEQKYVHIDTLVSDYFNFQGHFVSLYQLFLSRFWGDGPSAFGTNDGLAFPVGHIHWILILLVTILLVIKIFKTKKAKNIDWIVIFAILVGTGAAFMTHERSSFVWLNISLLKFIQFPWRFLTLNTFAYSFAAGSIFYVLKELGIYKNIYLRGMLLIILSATVIAFNWNFFKPVHSGPLTDAQKFSGESWRILQQAGIRDYFPIQATVDPNTVNKNLVDIIYGTGTTSNDSWGTNWAKFDISINSENSTVRVNLFNFPIWKAYIDGKETNIFLDKDEIWGRMFINVPEGNHKVDFKFGNTPLRTISNIISLGSWVFVLVFALRKRKNTSDRATI